MALVMQAFLILILSLKVSMAFGLANKSIIRQSTSDLKVIVFLSASCPCSKSHIDHLNELNSKYKNLEVYGVVTDQLVGPSKGKTIDYYSGKKFKFPVVEDSGQVLVKKYKALKTPHIVLLKKKSKGIYETIYEGGVTDRRRFKDSKKYFLKENLIAFNKNKPLPHKRGRSLGCYIRRL